MKRIILSIAAVTMFVVSANAQISDSYKANVKKMLHLAGSEATFSASIKQMFIMFKQQQTNVPEEVWTEFEKEFTQTSMDELVEMLIPVYHNHLTEADVKKMIEFYETPVGKKFAEKTPLITQESMQVGQQWGLKLGQQFMEKLKAKGY